MPRRPYPALVLTLRISGKRTLGKMNAFDLLITVALCSTVASALLKIALLPDRGPAIAAALPQICVFRALGATALRIANHHPYTIQGDG